jgi:hypothetical protein
LDQSSSVAGTRSKARRVFGLCVRFLIVVAGIILQIAENLWRTFLD